MFLCVRHKPMFWKRAKLPGAPLTWEVRVTGYSRYIGTHRKVVLVEVYGYPNDTSSIESANANQIQLRFSPQT